VPNITVDNWNATFDADRIVLTKEEPSTSELDASLPRLFDTERRSEVITHLDRLGNPESFGDAGLTYLRACVLAQRHAYPAALKSFTHAQSLVTSFALASRIALEMGWLLLSLGKPASAEAVLDWADSKVAVPNADLIHLRALIADHRGDWRRARGLYRSALRHSADALTPLSRVLLLVNLAVTLNQTEPEESISLCGVVLDAIDAFHLHPRNRSTAHNVMGYAHIALGGLAEARSALERSWSEASETGHHQVALFARFNIAILEEIEGRLPESLIAVAELQRDAASGGYPSLAAWAGVRRSWLTLQLEGEPAATRVLETTFRSGIPRSYESAVQTVRSIMRLRAGEPAPAAQAFMRLAREANAKGDQLSAFVLGLWGAYGLARSRQHPAARRTLRNVVRDAEPRRYRLSPNWWTAELVDSARELAGSDERSFVWRLIYPPGRPENLARPDAGSLIARIPPGAWAEGRTGKRVLRRLAEMLAASAGAIPRDRLIDSLWPDSEGDAAVNNLYGALNDLRRVLEQSGLSVQSTSAGYKLVSDQP
jgi:tetratricopeptide (TPR) repeat protein